MSRGDSAPGVRHFRIDLRKATLGECWRLGQFLPVRCFLVMVRLGLTTWDPPQTITRCEAWPAAEFTDLPADAQARLAGPVKALERVGYTVRACGSVPVLTPDVQHNCLVLLLSEDRQTGAAVVDTRVWDYRETFVNLTTRFTDGTFGLSTNEPRFFLPPDGMLYSHHPHLPADDLDEQHRRNLERWEGQGLFPDRFGPREAAAVSQLLTLRLYDTLIDRGIFVELTGEEIDARLEAMRERAE